MTLPVGAFDCHLHHSPDVIDRKRWALSLAQSAARGRMGGIVLKSHHANTAGLAAQVSQLVPEVRVMGGIALNAAVGGLNPSAVRMAGRFGAKMLWMPTTSAANHVKYLNESATMATLRADSGDTPLTILDDNGTVLPVVGEILGEAKAADMGVATGHLSPEETLKLAEYASKGDFPMHRFLVTHADMPFTWMDDDAQQHIARLGGFMERLYMLTLSFAKEASPDALAADAEYSGESFYMPDVGLEGVLKRIRDGGIQHSLFSSDLGQLGNPDPVPSMNRACDILRSNGFTDDELSSMAVAAPKAFLHV